MINVDCEKILESIESAGRMEGPVSGLEAELAEHARACVTCAEALGVASRLRRIANDAPPRSGLPSAHHLWWRAQIVRGLVADEQQIERATRPARWMQAFGLGLLCLLVASGLTWLNANLFIHLETPTATDVVPWRWLAGLLLASTVVPLAGFTALWIVWREA